MEKKELMVKILRRISELQKLTFGVTSFSLSSIQGDIVVYIKLANSEEGKTWTILEMLSESEIKRRFNNIVTYLKDNGEI